MIIQRGTEMNGRYCFRLCMEDGWTYLNGQPIGNLSGRESIILEEFV